MALVALRRTLATLLSDLAPRHKIDRQFWLIADQGLFAAGNFVTNILFARWLTPAEYGIFTISFGTYLPLSVIHYGAFIEPFLIQSGQVPGSQRRSFVLITMSVQIAMVAALLALTSTGFFALRSDFAWAVVAGGLGGSTLMIQLILRRLCFVFLSAKVSALVGAAYGASVIGSGSILHLCGDIRWYDVWLALGAPAVLSSLVMFWCLLAKTPGEEHYSLDDLFRFQRRYAPWSVISAISSWARGEGLILILAKMSGLQAAATTRAIVNLGNPWSQLLVALNASWLVSFSADFHAGRRPRVRRVLLPACGLSAFGVLTAWAGYHWLVGLVYNGRYLEAAWQVPIHWFALGCLTFESVISDLFKASGRMFRGYVPQTAGAVVAVACSLVFIPMFGQPGVIYAFACSTIFGSAFCAIAKMLDKKLP